MMDEQPDDPSTDALKQPDSLSRRRLALVGVGVAALLAASILAIGFLRQTRRVEQRRQAVREALARHDLATARALIERWKAESPRDGEVDAMLARVANVAEDPAGVLAALENATAKGFDPAEIALIRANMLARNGWASESIPILRPAYDRPGPFDPDLADGLTRAYLSTFQFGPASQVIARWMKEAPDDARPYLYRNEIEQRSDAPADVIIANYRMALQRDPNLDTARLGLAGKLRDSQRSDEAEVEYQTYLKRNPRSVEALVGAGQLALRKGELAAAVKHFETALEIDPKESTALRELAQTDLRSGAYDRACRRLEAVIEIDPFDPEVHLSYSRALRFAGKEAEARKETETVARLRKEHLEMKEIRREIVERPDDLEVRQRATRWLLEHGHDAEGLEWAELTLKKQPGHPETCRLLEEYHRRKGNAGLANYYKLAAKPR